MHNILLSYSELHSCSAEFSYRNQKIFPSLYCAERAGSTSSTAGSIIYRVSHDIIRIFPLSRISSPILFAFGIGSLISLSFLLLRHLLALVLSFSPSLYFPLFLLVCKRSAGLKKKWIEKESLSDCSSSRRPRSAIARAEPRSG